MKSKKESKICAICSDTNIYPPICRKCGKNAFEISEIHTEEYFGRQCVLIPKEDLQKLKQKFGVSK
jgi:hypothetical protein